MRCMSDFDPKRTFAWALNERHSNRYDARLQALGATMKRREFVGLASGVAIIWAFAASAQQPAKVPHIGVLWHAAGAEQEGTNYKAIVKGFADISYIDGGNCGRKANVSGRVQTQPLFDFGMWLLRVEGHRDREAAVLFLNREWFATYYRGTVGRVE